MRKPRRPTGPFWPIQALRARKFKKSQNVTKESPGAEAYHWGQTYYIPFFLGELFSVIITGNFTTWSSSGNSLLYCNDWCCSSLEGTNISVTVTVVVSCYVGMNYCDVPLSSQALPTGKNSQWIISCISWPDHYRKYSKHINSIVIRGPLPKTPCRSPIPWHSDRNSMNKILQLITRWKFPNN